MRCLIQSMKVGRQGYIVVKRGTVEDTLKTAGIKRKQLLMTLVALWVFFPLALAAQNGGTPAKPAPPSAPPAFDKLPKLWHSEVTQHDFRVEVTNNLFRADWVDIPAVAAKQGAQIHTECRRAGSKWVGTSSIKMLFGIPGSPAGKDIKLCPLTVRFEVDSVSPEKITGHSEALHSFDVNACRVQETRWGAFTWIPKK